MSSYPKLFASRVADKCDRPCADREFCSCHHWAAERAVFDHESKRKSKSAQERN